MTSVPRRGDTPPTPSLIYQGVHDARLDVPIPGHPQPESQSLGSVHSVSFDPSLSPLPKGKLRPMVGVDRYEKHKMVTVEKVVKKHVCPPVTTQFLRWVFAPPNGTSNVYLRYVSANLLLKTGFPSCIPRVLCTGSMRKM